MPRIFTTVREANRHLRTEPAVVVSSSCLDSARCQKRTRGSHSAPSPGTKVRNRGYFERVTPSAGRRFTPRRLTVQPATCSQSRLSRGKNHVESPQGNLPFACLRGHSKQRFGSSWRLIHAANPADHSKKRFRSQIELAQNNPIQTGDPVLKFSSPFSTANKKCSLSHTGEQRQRALQKYHLRESYSSDRCCQAVTAANSEKIGGFQSCTKVLPIGKVHRFVTTPPIGLSISIGGVPANFRTIATEIVRVLEIIPWMDGEWLGTAQR